VEVHSADRVEVQVEVQADLQVEVQAEDRPGGLEAHRLFRREHTQHLEAT